MTLLTLAPHFIRSSDMRPLRPPPSPFFPHSQHPRFARVTRPYSAEEVVNKRGTLPISYPADTMGKKLWSTLESKARGEGGGCSITYGA
jgi:isocitrate lyase